MNIYSHYSTSENTSLAVTIIVFGVMAGFFWTYSFNVNYAMQHLDGQTYATVQSLFNVNVRHAMFFSFFFGGGVFSVLALIINHKHWRSLSFCFLLAASVVYILGIIFYTKQVNLPLNAYTESWDPKNLPLDWQSVRDQWNKANMLRVVSAMSAFILALLALMQRAKPQKINT
jgi:uncharacterized membrane protein